MISKDTIDKIFETVKIEEIVSDFIELKKRGVNYIGNCPFHNEKTPSLTVSATKGIFKCFGCGIGGNAIKFIMEIEHYSYPEALKFIANRYNIEIIEEQLTESQKKKKSKKEILYSIAETANNLFQKTLLESKDGKEIGLTYFKERGYNEEIIKLFELGYNSKNEMNFANNLLEKGFLAEDLVDSGLIINKRNKSYINRFKERVIFPIHSFSGRVLGFGGRAINSKSKAKYLNSPESIIYYKSKVLYGLFQSKTQISKEDNCFIVEGYTDVISMHQNGIKNVVSASGTALSLDQLKLISRITKNITLLFDGDEAGIKATYRSIDLALRESMNVKIVLFPSGEDPDSYSKSLSNEQFKSFLKKQSTGFIDYKLSISKLKKLKDPNDIVKMKRDIFSSIANIPDPLMRVEYCKIYHSKLEVAENIMLKEVSILHKKNISFNQKNKNPDIITPKNNVEKNNKLTLLEKEVLRILLNYGDLDFTYNKEKVTVSEMIINDLDADKIEFSNPLFNKLYLNLINIYNKENTVNSKHFINHKDSEIVELCVDLMSSKHSISKNWKELHNILTEREEENIKKTTEKTILALKKCHVDLKIDKIQKQIKKDNTKNVDLKKLTQLTKIKNQIAKALGRNID